MISLTAASEPPKAKFIGLAPPGSAKADPNVSRFKLPLWPASSRARDDIGEYQTVRQWLQESVEYQSESPPTSELEALKIDKEEPPETPPTPELRAREHHLQDETMHPEDLALPSPMRAPDIDEEGETPRIELPLLPQAEDADSEDDDAPYKLVTVLRTYDTEPARRFRKSLPQFTTDHPACGVTMYSPVPAKLDRSRVPVETYLEAYMNNEFACAPLFQEWSDYFELSEWWERNYKSRNS